MSEPIWTDEQVAAFNAMAVTTRNEPGYTARKILEINAAIIHHEAKLAALHDEKHRLIWLMKRFEKLRRCNDAH